MKKKLILLTPLTVIILALGGASLASTGSPASPANLRMVTATETSIQIGWGPSPVSAYSVTGVTRHTVTVAWTGVQDDTAGIQGYDVTRDGAVVATDEPNAYYTFSVGNVTKTFHVCVTGVNGQGQRGVEQCGTVSR